MGTDNTPFVTRVPVPTTLNSNSSNVDSDGGIELEACGALYLIRYLKRPFRSRIIIVHGPHCTPLSYFYGPQYRGCDDCGISLVKIRRKGVSPPDCASPVKNILNPSCSQHDPLSSALEIPENGTKKAKRARPSPPHSSSP